MTIYVPPVAMTATLDITDDMLKRAAWQFFYGDIQMPQHFSLHPLLPFEERANDSIIKINRAEVLRKYEYDTAEYLPVLNGELLPILDQAGRPDDVKWVDYGWNGPHLRYVIAALIEKKYVRVPDDAEIQLNYWW